MSMDEAPPAYANQERDSLLGMSLLPSEIYVSGMPFMMQGWNGKYKRLTKRAEFVMQPYILYDTIPIIGTKIFFQNGQWCLQRDGDVSPLFFNDSLEGSWGDFTISRNRSHFKKICVAVMVFIVLFVFK